MSISWVSFEGDIICKPAKISTSTHGLPGILLPNWSEAPSFFSARNAFINFGPWLGNFDELVLAPWVKDEPADIHVGYQAKVEEGCYGCQSFNCIFRFGGCSFSEKTGRRGCQWRDENKRRKAGRSQRCFQFQISPRYISLYLSNHIIRYPNDIIR